MENEKNIEETKKTNPVDLILEKLENMDRRMKRLETGGKEEFKYEKDQKDVTSAAASRQGMHPKIIQIVDEMLGEDFRMELEPRKDSPGFLFTLIVPERLSHLPKTERPVKDPDNPMKYKLDKDGVVEQESYQPEDRRSRAVASADSFDLIRTHCEKVRTFIVQTYQKQNKPIPEFKVKDQML